MSPAPLWPPETGARFAAVAVDVSAEAVNRTFDYAVPRSLASTLRPGHLVWVPFGSRRVAGVVVGLVQKPSVAEVKAIHSLMESELAVPAHLLVLARWLSDRYAARFIQALRPALPPGSRQGRIRSLTEVQVQLVVSDREAADAAVRLAPRAPKQARLLEELLAGPRPLPRAALLSRAGAGRDSLDRLVTGGLVHLKESEVHRDPFGGEDPGRDVPHRLTVQQAAALDAVGASVDAGPGETFLLHGVTGSGKTEVYLKSIEALASTGRQALVLTPEIALTPQLVRRFRRRFGDGVAVLHSALGAGERYDQWRRLARGEAWIAVGARSALFAPCPRPGLIILDEEHENTFKQEETPRYHARDTALELARLAGATVVLGSATPAVESYYRARQGKFRLLELPDRIDGRRMPTTTVVDMRDELAGGNLSIFSSRLAEGIRQGLARGEQTILFLNRRGFNTFVLCRECGLVVECPHCDFSLTYHAPVRRLRCHYCGHSQPVPAVCPGCGGRRIRFFGTGTQKVEALTREAFPGARVARMDVDTTRRKGAHRQIYDAFRRGEIDILVGTQMVAKGWHVPRVTLVGVVSADTLLKLPDFRSGERTYQLLTQVAGRAGRGPAGGEVVVQTYSPDHYSIQAARDHAYERFYELEISSRAARNLPPFSRLVRFLVTAGAESAAAGVAQALGRWLAARGVTPAGEAGMGKTRFLGPAPAPFARLGDNYRWHLVLRAAPSDPPEALGELLRGAAAFREELVRQGSGGGVRLQIDVDPYNML